MKRRLVAGSPLNHFWNMKWTANAPSGRKKDSRRYCDFDYCKLDQEATGPYDSLLICLYSHLTGQSISTIDYGTQGQGCQNIGYRSTEQAGACRRRQGWRAVRHCRRIRSISLAMI
jgi:hypothetical protein